MVLKLIMDRMVSSKTTSYYQREVQMQACWRHSIIVNSQLRWDMLPTKVQMVVKIKTISISMVITKQIIVIIAQREQYKEWKCIYEHRKTPPNICRQYTIADNLYILILNNKNCFQQIAWFHNLWSRFLKIIIKLQYICF